MPATRSTRSQTAAAAAAAATDQPAEEGFVQLNANQQPVETPTDSVSPGGRHIESASATTQGTGSSTYTETEPTTDDTLTGDITVREATHRVPPPVVQAVLQQRERALTVASTRKSTKAARLAKARAELIRLRIQLVKQKIERIEAEEDTDEESIASGSEALSRTNEWVENSILQNRRSQPQPEEEVPPRVSTEKHEPEVPRQKPAKAPQPQPQPQHTSTPTGAAPPTVKKEQLDLSELASAIALAARAGHSIPRHYIELPIFNGSHQEWLSFKAAYTATAPSYTEIENLARLRRSLKGAAKEAVENLLIYNASTRDVMKNLEARFGRPDAIALAEMDRLRALPKLTDSPRDICVFATKVANIVATLGALNKKHYLHSPEATKNTIEKLTPTIRYRWYDFAAEQKTEEPELVKLSSFLEREAERCAPYAQPEGATSGQSQRPQAAAPPLRRYTQKSYITNEASACRVCEEQGHTVAKCSQFIEADVNDRWNIAKSKSLCFRCLKHRTQKHTCQRKRCATDGCERSHHPLLHFSKKIEEVKTEVVASTWTPSQAYLKILPVQVAGPKGVANIYALLDDGSTVTLIDAEIAQKIGAEGPIDPLHIEAIANTEVEVCKSQRVPLTLHGTLGSSEVTARTITKLRLSPQKISRADIADCTHLTEIASQLCTSETTPKLLIGQDNWHLLMASETKTGAKHQPVASLTPLGWVLHGSRTRTLGQRVNYINYLASGDSDMDEQLKKFFAIESLAITPRRPTSDPEARALEILDRNTVQRSDGRYETALLWKSEDAPMPNNYDSALRRLLSIERKLDKNPELKARYEEQMEALIEKNYAEVAPPTDSNRKWYLPHFAVFNPMKPGKIRVVHDAAAKTAGTSLNDKLLTGPDLLQSLPGVLMRLRQHPIALSADIREMFMQVKIRVEDRDALRYLWRGGERGDQAPREYRMTSLIFGATSSPSTAIYVKNKNAEKHRETHPEAFDAIVRSHYMDDYLRSFTTEEQAIETSRKVRDIHKEAHFELRQWTSNSSEVLRALEDSSERPPEVAIGDSTKTERVLGLVWKPQTDQLAFNLNLARLSPQVINTERPTKREALKIVMSLFDPLGFASPVTTKAKQLLQEVWRRGTDWDQPIDEDLAKQWAMWMEHLRNLGKIAIPRCHLHYSDATDLQLHVFVDASESAYAATLYWRIETEDGRVFTSLVIAKARVAPLKLTSIPRLELQAAVMGSRMAATVIEEHDRKPDSKTFWTDSRTVLTWIRNGARSYKPYVAHRIADIEENTKLSEWRWVPTKMNVADDATRDVPSELSGQHRWFEGPEFLRQPASNWPTEKPISSAPTGEEKSCVIAEKEKSPKLREVVPDPDRFSKWEYLLRATARVLQFIHLCKKTRERTHYKRTRKNKEKDPAWGSKIKTVKLQETSKQTEKKNFAPIEAQYMIEAERLIVRRIQDDNFSEEIKMLSTGKSVPTNSRLRPLAVEIVNGVIRLKSRITAAADVPETVKRPAVIDGDHRATKLYIDFVHRKLHHASVECTINECRQEYWVLKLRPSARMVIHRCLPCKIRKATPSVPPTGDHLANRLAHHQRPFTFVGVDYFGPITVTVGRTHQKRYVALFTCLTTRALHLEVAASLSTDSAVMALRRMIARRGCPTEIWSDNGTNLRGADKELREAIDGATQEEATNRKIAWRFIPPAAPFMGGAWERLVRSVKTALTATLHERHPTEEVLTTLLAEVEYTVNSRPLTHVSVDPADPEAITPNHFLLGGSARVPTPGKFEERDLIGKTYWRASQRLADVFWQRWVREYLPELQNRREAHGRGEALKIDDVVLITDNTLPRNTWPRGKVIATYPGPDGVVRAADIKTRGGILRRPTKRLW